MASINAGSDLLNTGDESGVLELQAGGITGVSINANGMYVKSVTTAQMTSLAGVNGMIVFNISLTKFCQYVNGAWQQMTSTATVLPQTQRAIFGYGSTTAAAGNSVSTSNLVSSTGVVATDTTGIGTARMSLAAATYSTDKGIFAYGLISGLTTINTSSLVSNTGVIATDTTGVGTSRRDPTATGYGTTGQAIFAYGSTTSGTSSAVSMSNLVSNTGTVATDTTGVGTARDAPAAARYGITGQAIIGYGLSAGTTFSITNLVTNTGVIGTNVTGVGTARRGLGCATYGTSGQAIFAYGGSGSGGTDTTIINLVSNTGIVATDTTGVGTARRVLAASGYGIDKAIFGFGFISAATGITNLVSNTGVVATDTAAVATARSSVAAAGYSLI
jgi:hypothetical protein